MILPADDLAFLEGLARATVEASRVAPGESVAGSARNTGLPGAA